MSPAQVALDDAERGACLCRQVRHPQAERLHDRLRDPRGSRIGPSSTSQTPSEYSWRSARAASIARLVFPTPPGPVSVTSRCPASRASTCARSSSRPTKLVRRSPMFVRRAPIGASSGAWWSICRSRRRDSSSGSRPSSRAAVRRGRGRRRARRRAGRSGRGPPSGAAPATRRGVPLDEGSRSSSASRSRPRSSRADRRRLPSLQLELGQAADLRLGEVEVDEVAVRLAADEAQRGVRSSQGIGGLGTAGLGDELLEALRVDAPVGDREAIAGSVARDDRCGRGRPRRLQHPAQSGDPGLERPDGRGALRIVPDGVDDFLRRDRAPEVDEQVRENRTLPGTPEVERSLGPYDLQRAEDVELRECYARAGARGPSDALGRSARGSAGSDANQCAARDRGCPSAPGIEVRGDYRYERPTGVDERAGCSMRPAARGTGSGVRR